MSQPAPKTDEAIEFLKKLRTQGPWTLTSILPDRGKITTKTFSFEQLSELKKWIDGFQGIRNIYFTLNTIKSSLDTKPQKTDISELSALHCDCDIRVGEDFSTGRERILKKLKEFTPEPSIIIDSGNGFQPIFLLQEPVVLDGTVEMAEEYESYNRQLEILLEGDHCFNVDRILRLPGTINVPDAKKIKKGRIPVIASIVAWIDKKYSLLDFTKAPTKIQLPITLGKEQLPGGGEKIKISGNVAPIYIEDLSKKNINIPDKIKVLIVQGFDPDEPNKYPSRSEPLFAVCCALVRAGADDETIFGVITNRDNAIASSVLDKPRPERYATKQIQDAKEEVEDPSLRELNSRHAVIADVGGKCRIISETFDHSLKRPRISFQTFQDFIHRYCNRKVQIATDADGKPICKPAGQWWINHIQRRQYETVIFAPGRDVPQAYNLWCGFACEAIPGNCDIFLSHIQENICQNNEEYYKYLLGWMARCVQHPDCPGEVAVVLRGEMGTGKGVFAKHFGSLFGRHFLQVSDPKHLVGSFNSHLRDCIVLFGDEAFWAGDKKHESVLKSLVTEGTLAIEQKGVDVFASPNYTHIILASNANWVVPAGSNERRFFALDVSDAKMQDKKYFSTILSQMNNGGREALLHFLLNYDISNFEVRDVPKTGALQDQKVLSMSSEEMWWYEKLEEGRLLKEHDNWECEVMKNTLQDDYVLFMQRIGAMRKSSATILGKFLARACPDNLPRSYQRMAKVKVIGNFGEELMINRRMYFYELPNIEKCREHWDKYYGGPYTWHSPLVREELRAAENMFA